ncbi:MAG: hypothetical protein ACOY3L_03675 [Pseudomonadota bacterium]
MPGFTGLPPAGADPRAVAAAINRMLGGALNVTKDVTLAANAATTTVSDPRIGVASFVGLMPLSANAAAELGAGTLWLDPPGKQSVVIHHASNAQADRSFRLLVIG